MATTTLNYRFRVRRGITAAVAADIPLAGELLLDTTTRTLTVGDGATAGGLALHKASVGLGNVTNDAQLRAAQLSIDGTLASNSDEEVPSVKAVRTYVAAHGGGGSGDLSWGDALTAAAAGLVHHWQMAETSGAACADSVGSLGLTLTAGSYTRGIDSPIGKAVSMVSSYMVSAGLGSIPIGAAARTIGVAFKAGETPGVIVSYGDQAPNRSWLALQTSSSIGNECPYAIGCTGDPLRYTYGGPAIRDNNWHLAFIRYNGSRVLSIFMDGMQHTLYLGAALSFPSTGNFYAGAWYVAGAVGNTGTQTIGDIMVWNRALTVAEIRRLTNAFHAAAP